MQILIKEYRISKNENRKKVKRIFESLLHSGISLIIEGS
jgi:hypothetical protein